MHVVKKVGPPAAGELNTWLWVVPAVLVVAMTVATVLLDLRALGVAVPSAAELEPGWPSALAGLAQTLPGALLLRLLPRHPVAWVLAIAGITWSLNGLAAAWATYAIYVAPGAPGASASYWLYARFGATLLLWLPLLILLFPDGRLPVARLWRRLSVVSLTLTSLLPTALMLAPLSALARYEGYSLPAEITRLALDPVAIGLPYDVWQLIRKIVYVSAWVGQAVPFAVMVHRYRAADAERRAQIRWLMWAALVDGSILLFPLVLPEEIIGLVLVLAIAFTSSAVVVAVTKYRLYDIHRLLPATLLYGVLAALVVVIDVAVFTAAGSLLDERQAALAALAVVAVLYLPLRTWLTRVIRRLVRGPRDDPYGTMATLAERLESAADPDEQLIAVARTLAEVFRLAYVRVEIERPGGERSVVEHGSPRGPSVSMPVAYRGEQVGRLVLCRTDLTERDQRLLGDLVRQAAAAARASELSVVLQRIRSRLVVAREEERRRLRRDLHDGLGPSLGAVALRIETARNLIEHAPRDADRILEQTAAEVATVVADIRQIVHDLRPPALDELGVARAIEQQADRFRTGGLTVVVSGGEALGALPAAVEVAAYRIVSEALTNVARHARASRCDITLSMRESVLDLQVRDDGVGVGAEVTAGVGTLSLRERAAELGGDCRVICPPEGGTLVHARLPVEQVREMTGV